MTTSLFLRIRHNFEGWHSFERMGLISTELSAPADMRVTSVGVNISL